MKNNLLIIIITAITAGIFALFYSVEGSPAPCSKPLTYRIASIDSRYNIDKQQVRKLMLKVEQLWSTALGRELLVYDDHGEVGIHLIFSSDQQRSREERKLSEKIEAHKARHKLLSEEYDRLSNIYKNRQTNFKALVVDYNRTVKRLNNSFSEWQSGGVSEAEERAIRQEKRELKNLKYRADQLETELNSMRKRLNQKSTRLNGLSKRINNQIQEYNSRYAKRRKFHQGRYIKNGPHQTIKIFQFGNKQELMAVLAHEMGHALGLDHVKNPESVMYYLMDAQNIHNLALSDQDMEALKTRCSL